MMISSFEMLRGMPPERMELVVRNCRSLQTPATCYALIAYGWERRDADAASHLGAQAAAVAVAEVLSPGVCGGQVALSALRARAWAHLGNAQRVHGRLREARAALRRADHYSRRGEPGAEFVALLHEFRASLCESIRDLPGASRHLAEALALRRGLGDRPGALKVEIQRGIVAHEGGDDEEAVRRYYDAILLIQGGDETLARLAYLGLMWCLIEVGRADASEQVRQRVEVLLNQGGELIQVRHCWIRGRIAEAQGGSGQGRALLRAAHERYADLGLPLEAALSGLDLAMLELRLGEAGRGRAILGAVESIFVGTGVAREALASRMLQRAAATAENGAAAADLVARVAVILRTAGPRSRRAIKRA